MTNSTLDGPLGTDAVEDKKIHFHFFKDGDLGLVVAISLAPLDGALLGALGRGVPRDDEGSHFHGWVLACCSREGRLERGKLGATSSDQNALTHKVLVE